MVRGPDLTGTMGRLKPARGGLSASSCSYALITRLPPDVAHICYPVSRYSFFPGGRLGGLREVAMRSRPCPSFFLRPARHLNRRTPFTTTMTSKREYTWTFGTPSASKAAPESASKKTHWVRDESQPEEIKGFRNPWESSRDFTFPEIFKSMMRYGLVAW